MLKTARLALLGTVLALLSCATFAQQPESTPVTFSIESQSMLKALNAWAQQAKLQLIWPGGSQIAQQLSPRVVGRFMPREALQMLLKGSALEATMVDAQTIEIRPANLAAAKRISLLTETSAPATTSGQSSPVVRANPEESSPKAQQTELPTPTVAEVLVTGTHIRGVSVASPMITLDRTEIDRSGYTTTGDFIRALPQNFSGGNSPQIIVGNAPQGGNTASVGAGSAPNLRGLGPGSTLTLVDGKRFGQDALTGAVDISSVPLNMIERVDVVTDGSSTTYGSDAVAGVVNFVLKRPYDGAETSASLSDATSGGGFERRFSQSFGKLWGSGGVLIAYEGASQDKVVSSERRFTATVLRPYSLLPQTRRNSFSLNASQDISPNLGLFATGLYTSRSAEVFQTFVPTTNYANNSDVQQYVTSAGVNVSLPYDWKMTTFANISNQKTVSTTKSSAPDGSNVTLTGNEQLHGRTRAVEANANGPLLKLPAGYARAAVGAGYRNEEFDDNSAIPGRPVLPIANGDRNIKYVFVEAAMPIYAPADGGGVGSLDLSISGRFERYSDFGSTSIPKVGLSYKALSDLKLRGSWGRSFRAPSLGDLFLTNQLVLARIPDPRSSTGRSIALFPGGGNPDLDVEKARNWTIGVDYSPADVEGFNASITYFDINYTNRIGRIPNIFAAFTDPTNTSFVTRNPSPAEQAEIISSSKVPLTNLSGAAYDPSTVAAIVDNRYINIAKQQIRGIDGLLDYKIGLSKVQLDFYLNAAYLRIQQQRTPLSTEQQIAGLAFNPPRFRSRAGVTWSTKSLVISGMVNYVDHFTNFNPPTIARVSSWTTFDAQVAYVSSDAGPLQGLRISLSGQNLLNKDPPFLTFDSFRTGFNYDSVNASPIGRVISLQATKEW